MDQSDGPTVYEEPVQPGHTYKPSFLQRMSPRFGHLKSERPIVASQQTAKLDGSPSEKPVRARSGGLEGLLGSFSHAPRARANPDFPQEKLITHEDRLSDYRRLIGIDSSPSHTLNSGYFRAGENLGIYTQIVNEEKDALRRYKSYSWLINASMGLQLVFAAGLTALGAGDGSRGAITAFGAMSTILAGTLTFLKGSGLPNREKYFADQWKKVRGYIEQREREFGRVGCSLDVDTEVRAITAMFNETKHEVQANQPDGFTSVLTKGAHNFKEHLTTPGALEAAYNQTGTSAAIAQRAAPDTNTVATPHQGGLQGVLDRISSQVDPASKAGKILSQVTSLHAKYGDTILEKLGHLHDHGSTQQFDEALSKSEQNIGGAADKSMAAGQQLAQQHISVASDLLSKETQHLSSVTDLANSRAQDLSQDFSDRTTVVGNDMFHHAQTQAERVAETAQAGVDRLTQIERQAEAAVRNLGMGITNEFRGLWDHGRRHEPEGKS